MKPRDWSIIAAVVVVGTLVAACVPADSPATSVPIQPTPTDIPATPVPVQPTPTSAPPTATPAIAAGEWPSPRKYGAMVYDPVSERLFMFGGVKYYESSRDFPEVWAYEPVSNRWEKQGRLAPKMVVSAALDEESQRVIVFGRVQGRASGYEYGDTWAYDPAADTWEQMNPATAPSERWASVMVYDAESDRIILFGGGFSVPLPHGDTWVYDYNTNTWTEMQPEVSPPHRAFHGMVYVPEIDRILLWGGRTKLDVRDSRVWAYDYNANTWTAQEAPSDAPEQERSGFMLFFHSASGRMIVYGGLTELDGRVVGPMMEETTWAYDYRANSWQALEPSENPGQRAHFLMAYAPSIERAVLFGGERENKYANQVSDEVWMFDAATNEWLQVTGP